MQSVVFIKDYEEERKDQERAYQQLEALKSSNISETMAQNLQAEVLRTTQERDWLQIKLEDSKTQYQKLWDENVRLNYNFDYVCKDMMNVRDQLDLLEQRVSQLDLQKQKVSRLDLREQMVSQLKVIENNNK